MTQPQARQLKLGAILSGVGSDHYTWRDPELPGDASIDIDWYIENARLAEASKFDLAFIVDAHSPGITVDSNTRTNVGCFDQSGAPNMVKATILDNTGKQTIGSVTLNLAANGWGQTAVTSIVSGGYVQFDPTDQRDMVKNFVKNFKAKFNADPTHINAHAYDQIMLIGDVVKRGAKDAQTIRDTLAATKDFKGVTGSVEFDKSNQNTKMDTVHYMETKPDLSWNALKWN